MLANFIQFTAHGFKLNIHVTALQSQIGSCKNSWCNSEQELIIKAVTKLKFQKIVSNAYAQVYFN